MDETGCKGAISDTIEIYKYDQSLEQITYTSFCTKHPRWCSEYNAYRYSESQQTQFKILLCILQLMFEISPFYTKK